MNGRICKALAILALAGGTVLATSINATAQIRTGMFGAVSYNTTSASMQHFITGINGSPLAPNDFSGGSSVGGYAGALGEFMIDDRVSLSLRAAYDQRNVEVESNNNMLTARLSYLTIDPGVRVTVGPSPLHVVVGPTMAFKLSGKYTYDSRSVEPASDVTNGQIPNVRPVAFGGWAELGYDFTLNRPGTVVAMYLTPFIQANYLVDQVDPYDAGDASVMNTLTGRLGLQVTAQW
jgi:hypothetical protein